MSKKIIVTTDLSANSKAGMMFAIQLASQHPMHLIFLHAFEFLILSRWSNAEVTMHKETELKSTEEALQQFVKSVYKEAGVRPRNYECVVKHGVPADRTIIKYAVERKANFICMSTRGAGGFRRIIGTHTSSVIKNSPVPVLAIPKNYKREKIDQILYASDLNDLTKELKKVKTFAALVKAKVSVLHYDYFVELKETREQFKKVASRYDSSGIAFHLQQFDWEETLGAHIKKAIRKFKPAMVVLFTKHERNWYQRIFLSSKSADVSYDTRKPILVFPK